MATRTRKVPQINWERHKETILSLYLTSDLSTDELVKTMEKDHGLSATISQFEAQLRTWKARKNLKRHEWEDIIENIDHLASKGVQSRVVISGHPVPSNRIYRARRYCRGEHRPEKRRRMETDVSDATNNRDASDVMIEVQEQNGNWSPYIAATDESGMSRQQQGGPSEPLGLLVQAAPVNSSDDLGLIQDGTANGVHAGEMEPFEITDMSLQLSSAHTPCFMPDNWLPAIEDENFLQAMDRSHINSGFQVSQSLNLFESDLDIPLSTFDLTSLLASSGLAQFPGNTYLENLPFEQFEREPAWRHLSSIIRPSPMQDNRFLSVGTMFVTEAVAAMTKANGKSLQQNFYSAGLTLRTLDSIFPRSQQNQRSSNLARSSQEMLEIEVPRLLLFSAANGFVGMDDIPIKAVLGFLNHNNNVASLLSRFFRETPGHVAKSLAENLFRAAIESDDHQATRFFLETRLVDVNKVVCFAKGRKYTPLERAAELQELKVVHELLQFKPDANLTFLSPAKNSFDYNIDYENTYFRGPLACLTCGFFEYNFGKPYHGVIPLEFLGTVDALIEAGAKIHSSYIEHALLAFVRVDLAKKLLFKLTPNDHSMIMSDKSGILRRIAQAFSDEDANEAIMKIISDCEKTECRQCLSRFPEEFDAAIIVGAERGHIQLIRSLFKYAQFPDQVLCGAIRSGNHELVQFVRAQKPDNFYTPMQWTERNWWMESERRPSPPLAEAIEAKDETLIRMFENEGVLAYIQGENDHFAFAISAAARVGDTNYARKLLLLKPHAKAIEMEEALFASVEHQQEEMFRFLVDAGANFLLSVRHGHLGRRWDLNLVLIRACEWGNMSVISDLMSTFPQVRIDGNRESLDTFTNLMAGNMDLFKFLLESGRLTRKTLTVCLIFSIKRNDGTMLRHLLESGANASDEYALEIAAKGNRGMLRILLAHIPSTKGPISCFGTAAVVEAIRRDDLEVLEMLLACKSIDFKSISETWTSEPIYSPLGVAIKKEAASPCADLPFTRRFLDAGCDIDGIVQIDRGTRGHHSNTTPLLEAISAKNKNLVQFLIARGAQVNRAAVLGIKRTPLQAAAKVGSLDIVELLLQNGADVNGNPAGGGGGTALQCAAMGGNCNIAAKLLDDGALLNALPSMLDGRWPLEGAAEYGRLDMIQFLWNVSGFWFPVDQCLKAIKLAEGNGHGACKDLIRELAVSNGIILTLEGTD
ncbi:ankyrin [Hypoxylon crocopeplum]|nr:ankyrin [Hypoxylon crocopeplum]